MKKKQSVWERCGAILAESLPYVDKCPAAVKRGSTCRLDISKPPDIDEEKKPWTSCDACWKKREKSNDPKK